MRTISAISIAALSGALAGPPAFFQAFADDDADLTEVSWRLDAGLVAAASSEGDDDLDLLGDLSAGVDIEVLSDSGRRWGFSFTGRAERDSGRRGWGGRAGDCPAGFGDCATLTLAGLDHPVRNPVSGLHAAGPESDDDGIRLALEEAYGFVHTGWGELRVGYGSGAADIDAEKGPTAFRLSRADGGRVDLTGLSGARTRNLSSGFSPKIVFRSIQLGQVSTVGVGRVSVSYTPEVRDCGVDLCVDPTGPAGLLSPAADHVFELGARYEIHRGDNEFAISLGIAAGDDASGLAGFEGVRTQDAGLSWRNGSWRAGARWLRSNSGVAVDGDYEAWSASLGYESGDWLTTIEMAQFSDDLVQVSGESWQASASRLIGERWIAGFGVQYAERDEPFASTSGRVMETVENTAVFVELGWQF